MVPFEYSLSSRIVFGEGVFERLGELAREIGFRRTLLVADRGIVVSGYVEQAMKHLSAAAVDAFHFQEFDENPTVAMIEAGRVFAAGLNIDSFIGLGGGSSMDCAKGINFVLTNGGSMRDYRGYGKAAQPLLPMIGVPTTSGTGSEAQSYALISDASTHEKMACGDPTAAFRIIVLDPVLTVTQPASVTAVAGFDAISHSVETFVSTKRTAISQAYSREAWRMLEANYERVIAAPGNIEARAAMQLGAFFAGVAIENSMLGAAHACANPLTAHYDTQHGIAVGLMLPHVVSWNNEAAGDLYAELLRISRRGVQNNRNSGRELSARLEELKACGGLPRRLRDEGVKASDLDELSREAAGQWTGTFNPRPFDAAAARLLYQSAF